MKLVTESEIEHNAMSLEIAKDGSMSAPVTMYVTTADADSTALKLSRIFGPEYSIQLTLHARIKAIYRDGIRVRLNDYQSFYTNLADEQYRATKIQDSRTAEWI